MQRQEDPAALIALRNVVWKKRDVLNGAILNEAPHINPDLAQAISEIIEAMKGCPGHQ